MFFALRVREDHWLLRTDAEQLVTVWKNCFARLQIHEHFQDGRGRSFSQVNKTFLRGCCVPTRARELRTQPRKIRVFTDTPQVQQWRRAMPLLIELTETCSR